MIQEINTFVYNIYNFFSFKRLFISQTQLHLNRNQNNNLKIKKETKTSKYNNNCPQIS